MASLGLRCSAQALYSCRAQDLGALASVIATPKAQYLQLSGSRTQSQKWWCLGLAAVWNVGSSELQIFEPLSLHCRQILIHCITGEILLEFFF